MKDDKRFQAVSTFFVILFLIGNHLCILPRRHFTFIHVPHVSWLSGSSVPYRVYCNAFLYLFEFINKCLKLNTFLHILYSINALENLMYYVYKQFEYHLLCYKDFNADRFLNETRLNFRSYWRFHKKTKFVYENINNEESGIIKCIRSLMFNCLRLNCSKNVLSEKREIFKSDLNLYVLWWFVYSVIFET